VGTLNDPIYKKSLAEAIGELNNLDLLSEALVLEMDKLSTRGRTQERTRAGRADSGEIERER
jgi:hypothetical protein